MCKKEKSHGQNPYDTHGCSFSTEESIVFELAVPRSGNLEKSDFDAK